MVRHILDRPVWSALSTRQSQVAIGGAGARRFVPEVGPLAAACDDDPKSLAALGELISPGGALILLQADPIVLPLGVEVVTASTGVQMIFERFGSIPDEFGVRVERLSEEDGPAMVALAALTKPGPFERGTPRLGEFWGIKENGELLAMAGERMKQPGYTEVSGVCTHPNARGRGFARILSTLVAQRIVGRGETPYLHSYAANTPAIRLYELIGFRARCSMHIATIARQGVGVT